MATIARNRAAVVWAVLVLATAVSWWLGTNHGPGGDRVAFAVVLAVAFLKVRFVGLDFMELRGAPTLLRGLFQGWVVVVGLATITLAVR